MLSAKFSWLSRCFWDVNHELRSVRISHTLADQMIGQSSKGDLSYPSNQKDVEYWTVCRDILWIVIGLMYVLQCSVRFPQGKILSNKAFVT